jgi:hypothetical protein
MIKILSFGRSCKTYFRLYKDHSPNMKLCCEGCSRTLHKHGFYVRWVTSKRDRMQIPIYRWFCPSCKITVSLLPDFLVPWARFTTFVREAAVVRKRQGRSFRRIAQSITIPATALSPCTVKRWWKRHVKHISAISLWMARQLVAAGCDADLLDKHPKRVDATPPETVHWLEQLQKLYVPDSLCLRGYWSFFNARLPRELLL